MNKPLTTYQFIKALLLAALAVMILMHFSGCTVQVRCKCKEREVKLWQSPFYEYGGVYNYGGFQLIKIDTPRALQLPYKPNQNP